MIVLSTMSHFINILRKVETAKLMCQVIPMFEFLTSLIDMILPCKIQILNYIIICILIHTQVKPLQLTLYSDFRDVSGNIINRAIRQLYILAVHTNLPLSCCPLSFLPHRPLFWWSVHYTTVFHCTYLCLKFTSL